MDDYCIENDFATQREMAEIEGDRIQKIRADFQEYKNAMEFYFGRSKCFEALEQYRNEIP